MFLLIIFESVSVGIKRVIKINLQFFVERNRRTVCCWYIDNDRGHNHISISRTNTYPKELLKYSKMIWSYLSVLSV